MNLIRIGIWPTLGPPSWVVLPPKPFKVGRSGDCAVRLDDPAVSAWHAEVRPKGGDLVIRDLASTNGTRVDGERVEEAVLTPESAVTIGGYTLRFDSIPLEQAPRDELQVMFTHDLEQGGGSLTDLAQAWTLAAPQDPRAYQMLTRYLLKENDLPGAIAAADKAALLAPHKTGTIFAQALVAEGQGKLDTAAEHLDRALVQDPSLQEMQSARQRIGRKQEVFAKLSALAEVEDGQAPAAPEAEASFQAGSFSFRFLPQKHGDLVMNAYAVLAAVSENIEELLGYLPDECKVLITNAPGDDDLPGKAAARYRGAIEVYADRIDTQDPNFLYVALAHEYAHLVLDRISGGSCPAWLDEGIAQYITQNQAPRDRSILHQALAQDAPLPLELLSANFTSLGDDRLIDLAYAQAYSLVEHLLEQKGWDGIRHILAALGQGGPLDKALAKVGLTLRELETSWRNWLA